MIEDKDIYLFKMKKIDEMLESKKMYDEYIKNIENTGLQIPSDLTYKIKNKVLNKNDNKDNIKINNDKLKYVSYLKVASFVLIVMVTWNMMLNSNIINKKDYEKDLIKENKLSMMYGKINEYTSNFSNLLLNPNIIKGGEK